jgi:hypothetical protein
MINERVKRTEKGLWSSSREPDLRANPDYAIVGVGLRSSYPASHLLETERSLAPGCRPKRRSAASTRRIAQPQLPNNWFGRGSLLMIGSSVRPEDRPEPQPHFYLDLKTLSVST